MIRSRELSASVVRRMNRSMSALADIWHMDELEKRFIETANHFLPGDCTGWNNWSIDWTTPINYRTNDGYGDWLARHSETFSEVVPWHPVISTPGEFADSARVPKRLSDYVSQRAFRENPLFREIYRHMDSRYQLAYTPCLLSDRRIILTWNRRALDFSRGDCETMHHLGRWVDVLATGIDRRDRLLRKWNSLCQFIDGRLGDEIAHTFTPGDSRMLSRLLEGRTVSSIAADMGIRTDTAEKRIGVIRERLGLENQNQLLSALAALKPTTGPAEP